MEGLAFKCCISVIIVCSLQPETVCGNEKPFGILLQSKENEDLRKMHAWQTEVCVQWVM